MPTEPGGEPNIGNNTDLDPISFYQSLPDSRIHSLYELEAMLHPFEHHQDYERENMSDADLEEYLEHPENKYWGNPDYRYEPEESNVTGYLSLEYSPWLHQAEDTLLQGRFGIDNSGGFEKLYEEVSNSTGNQTECIPDDTDDILWISIPTNPDLPPSYVADIQQITINFA